MVAQDASRQIPRPAGEDAGHRDDAPDRVSNKATIKVSGRNSLPETTVSQTASIIES